MMVFPTETVPCLPAWSRGLWSWVYLWDGPSPALGKALGYPHGEVWLWTGSHCRKALGGIGLSSFLSPVFLASPGTGQPCAGQWRPPSTSL